MMGHAGWGGKQKEIASRQRKYKTFQGVGPRRERLVVFFFLASVYLQCM